MSRRQLATAWMIIASVVACASEGTLEPPDGLTHALGTPMCGPADGPAVGIYLAAAPIEIVEPTAPYVRIAVWQPLDRLTTRSWVLNDGDASAAAWYFRTTDDFEVATSGRVTVKAVEADTTIRGSVELSFPTAGHITGAFNAVWLPRVTVCG